MYRSKHVAIILLIGLFSSATCYYSDLSAWNKMFIDSWLPTIKEGLGNSSINIWIHQSSGKVQINKANDLFFETIDKWPPIPLELRLSAHMVFNLVASLNNVIRNGGTIDSVTSSRLLYTQIILKNHTWAGTSLSPEQIANCDIIHSKSLSFIETILNDQTIQISQIESYVQNASQSLKYVVREASYAVAQHYVDLYTSIKSQIDPKDLQNIYFILETGHYTNVGTPSSLVAEYVFGLDITKSLILKMSDDAIGTEDISDHILNTILGTQVFNDTTWMHHDILGTDASNYLQDNFGYSVKQCVLFCTQENTPKYIKNKRYH